MAKKVDYKKLSESELIEMTVGRGKSQWLKRDPETGRLTNSDEVIRLNIEEDLRFGEVTEFDKVRYKSRLTLWLSLGGAALLAWILTMLFL